VNFRDILGDEFARNWRREPMAMPPQRLQASSSRTGEAASTKASVNQLQVAVRELGAENDALKGALYECRAGMEGLRSAVGALKSELKFVTERLDSTLGELKAVVGARMSSVSGEVQATAHELAGLRAHGNALESSLDSARAELHTHGDALKEVAIVRTGHGFIAATSARLEQGVAEQGRLLSDLRAEVAGLSQRHVALNSSVRSEQSAATQVTTALRSTVEAQAMQIDVLSAKLVSLGGNDEFQRAVDKLKRVVRRAESWHGWLTLCTVGIDDGWRGKGAQTFRQARTGQGLGVHACCQRERVSLATFTRTGPTLI
jgi:chromosome segregation ATPase